MNPNELVESKWMVAEEFGLKGIPREPQVTIKAVKLQKVGAKENWGVLHFVEDWAKPLKVNTTSKRACMLMFSETDTNKWIGKRLDLYAKPGHYPKGKTIAVRIKGSPDITKVMSFTVQSFGGGDEVYNLMPSGTKTETPYERMWRTWRAAGHSSEPDFKALIKTATGKTTPKQLDDSDVARFEAALVAQSAPPPMTEEEQQEISAREAEPGSGG